MAISLGIFSSFLAGETAVFAKSSSSLRFPPPANVRTVRTVTFAAASKPAMETKKREPRGIMKPRRVSPEMQAFLGGVPEIPRTQALKEIWAYIKEQNLQVVLNKTNMSYIPNMIFLLCFALADWLV